MVLTTATVEKVFLVEYFFRSYSNGPNDNPSLQQVSIRYRQQFNKPVTSKSVILGIVEKLARGCLSWDNWSHISLKMIIRIHLIPTNNVRERNLLYLILWEIYRTFAVQEIYKSTRNSFNNILQRTIHCAYRRLTPLGFWC